MFVFVFGEAGDVGGEVDEVKRRASCSCADVGEAGEEVWGDEAGMGETPDVGEVTDVGDIG